MIPVPKSSEVEENDDDNVTKVLYDVLLQRLQDYEVVLHYCQLLLVWEKPLHSILFVFLLHIIIWYLKLHSSHIIGVISLLLLFLIWLDVWKHRIWPEIRARDPDPDEWVELHPRLLSLPEFCMTLAVFLVNFKAWFRFIYSYRWKSPGKFMAICVTICIVTAYLGNIVSGLLIIYMTIVCCLVWPLIWYHRLLELAYVYAEPLLMQLQYSLKPRMKRSGKRVRRIDDESFKLSPESSLEEGVMEPLDAVTAEVLARALTDDDEVSESDESLLMQELPSFMISSISHD